MSQQNEKVYQEARAIAEEIYGTDPHSFGGQRDGFVRCYQYLTPFLQTALDQLRELREENERLKKRLEKAIEANWISTTPTT